MARLGAPGTGFSSMDPSQAVDTPAGLAARRRSSGGGRSSRRTPTYKTVKVDGNTVFINGKGFSVAPSLQANFIKQHTGGSGSSAQAAIKKAVQIEKNRQKEETRKNVEMARLDKLKTEIAGSQDIDRKAKEKYIKQINEQKKAVAFESKLRSGEILGFSGSGLTVEQERRRATLIKLRIAKEMSSKDMKGLYVDPLKTSFFISTTPTPLEKKSFNDYLKQIKQDFTPPVFRDRTSVEKYLDKFKLVQGVKRAARNLNIKIDEYKRTKGVSARQQLANQIHDKKKTFIQRLGKSGLISSKMVGRQAGMFALGFSSAIFSFAASMPRISGAVVTGTPGVIKGTPGFIKGTPAFVKNVITNPKNSAKKGWKVSKTLGKAIKDSGYAFGKLFMVEPGLALGQLYGEWYIFKGGIKIIGKGVKIIGKLTGKLTAKAAKPLKPMFSKIKVQKIAISKSVLKPVKKIKFIKRISKAKKLIKKAKDIEVKKFKSAVEYSKQLKGARVARKTARKKGFTVNIGDTNYIEAIAKVEQTAKNLGFNKAKIIIRRFENSGGKLGLGKAEEFIRIVQRFTVKELKKLPEYKKLVLAAKLNKPYQLKFLKIGKIQKARIIFNNVKIKVSNLPIIKKINKIFNKIKKSSGFEYLRKATREFKKLKSMSNKAINAEIKKFKLAVKRKKILTKLQKARLADLKQARKIRKIARRKILNKGKNKVTLAKQAKKSRLLDLKQARKIRKLSRQKQLAKRKKLIKAKLKPKKLKSLASSKETSRRLTKKTRIKILERKTYRNIKIQDIDKVNNYRNVNKVVDNLFDEVFRRQKISLAPVKYRMLKNNVKKKLIKAIKNGDKAQVNKFKAAAKKMIRDMDKPISQPSVKIVKKGSKSFRTIKDFKPEVPKGRYVEVRQGQQVMLQKVKQIQKAKSVKKIKPQLFVIQSVQKKTINLLPILRFASEVIASQSIKQLFKLKTKTTSKTISKTKQISTQGSKPLEKTAQDSISKLDVTQAVAQDVKSKLKPSIKQKKKLIREKKKQLLIPKIRERFKSKKLSSEIPTYYVVEKVRGKFKKLFPKPLTQKDARDYAVWSIDNHLSKTAFLVPMGGAKQIVRPPKNIAGYYSKHRIKVRKYKIRYGKKKQMLNGFIEKRKYFQDQPLEKAQMKRLRRKAIRKSPKRTAPPKKKKVKMSASRRKQMLSNLKKARSKLKRIRYKK